MAALPEPGFLVFIPVRSLPFGLHTGILSKGAERGGLEGVFCSLCLRYSLALWITHSGGNHLLCFQAVCGEASVTELEMDLLGGIQNSPVRELEGGSFLCQALR